MEFDKEYILDYIKNNNIVKTGEFTLKSGKTSEYYVDFRPLVSVPLLLKAISNGLYSKMQSYLEDNTQMEHNPVFICGLPYAGIPYSTTISILNNIPMVLLRKERKEHGTKQMIEGTISPGNEIILIDDILTTGTSIIESLEYLKEYKIKKVVVILDRREGGVERLKLHGIEVVSLFTIYDIV